MVYNYKNSILAVATIIFSITVAAAKQNMERPIAALSSKLSISNTDSSISKCNSPYCDSAFVFDNKNLESILKELGASYHVKVHYARPVSKKTYFGIFSRCDTLQMILEFLQSKTGVKLSVKGNCILVQPQ
jgi:hypothetical protein